MRDGSRRCWKMVEQIRGLQRSWVGALREVFGGASAQMHCGGGSMNRLQSLREKPGAKSRKNIACSRCRQ